METITLDKDIRVMYVAATSFPDGIKDAHEKLHSTVPFSTGRGYYGISRPQNGVIAYKAAAEELQPGEAEKFGLDTLIIKKGKYIGLTLTDYKKDLQSIAWAFQDLLAYPGIDPQGYCVEWYITDKEMKCMIRLAE